MCGLRVDKPANVSCHITGPREPLAALCKDGLRRPGRLSLAQAKGKPCRPPCSRDCLFSFFLARWCGFGRGISAEYRSRGGKGVGEGRGETPAAHLALQPALGSQTTGQWLQLPRRHFLPEQPGSSVLCQPSLRAPCLLFSKQAPSRSRDFSLRGDWARVPHMEAPLLEPLWSGARFLLPTPPRLSSIQALDRLRKAPPPFFFLQLFIFCPVPIYDNIVSDS